MRKPLEQLEREREREREREVHTRIILTNDMPAMELGKTSESASLEAMTASIDLQRHSNSKVVNKASSAHVNVFPAFLHTLQSAFKVASKYLWKIPMQYQELMYSQTNGSFCSSDEM